ncbi:hypothetical protein ACFPIF_15935 [Brevundimonas faecalis]|uniref:hypothetical protein n=1 Tax=Brevundimonas faecalis TaxID=947378 RepID=UPI0036162A32
MDGPDKEHLASLLRKNRRRLQAPAVIQAWSSLNVSVSRVSGDRQEQLLTDLRDQRGGEYVIVADVLALLHEFAGDASIVTVSDWNANEEPALMVPTEALCRSEDDLHRLYPDGLVVWSEAAALIVDFDYEAGEVRACRYERDRR